MKRGGKQAGRWRNWQNHLKWLLPGLGIKRWVLLLILGVGLLSLGGALALRALYPLPPYFHYLTLQFLPRPVRALLFMGVGAASLILGLGGLNRTMLEPFFEGTFSSIPEVLYDYRRRGRGPRIVVIGGGHGQSMMLRGLKPYTSNLTAIVTVADDGGSSGRLRRELGVLPPGDFRNCIAALADDESLVTRLFQYRFASGAELGGHSFGNLFISAMAGITGSFEGGLKESSRVLAVQGRVLPSTLQAISLYADVQKGGDRPIRVWGESKIPKAHGKILRMMLEPVSPRAYPEAIGAILAADLIVIGPGSLYTSILANLLVPEIAQALRAVQVPRVYVCNVATQRGETDGYSAQDHLLALEQHTGKGIVSEIVVNTHFPRPQPGEAVDWVRPDVESREGLRIIRADLIDPTVGWRHDSGRLAHVVMSLLK